MENKTPYISRKWMIVVTVLLGTFTIILNNSLLNPAIPQFMKIFQVDAVSAGWIISMFMLAIGMTLPLTGFLSNRFGKKQIYLIGLGLFIVASFLGSFSWSLSSIIFFRALQGIAGGLMMPLSMVLIFDAFPNNERGFAIGIWGIASMMAPTIGPTIGGMIIEYGSWQWLFLLNIPSGLLGFILGVKYLSRTKGNKNLRFDISGFILVTIGIGCLLFALGRISTIDDLTSILNIFLIAISVLLLVCFIRYELRQREPLLQLTIFKEPTYRKSIIIASVQAVGLFSGIFLIPLLVQMVYGYGPVITGIVFIPSALFTGIFMTLAGKILDVRGARGVVTIGIIITSVSSLLVGILTLDSPIWIVFVLMMLRGIGLGLSNMPATTAGLNALPDQLVPQGSVMNDVMRRLSSSLTIVLASIYFEVRRTYLVSFGSSMEFSSLQAIREIFIFIGIAVLFILPLGLKLKKT